MEGLEITIRNEEDSLGRYDHNILDNFQKQFENTPLGIALLKLGYDLTDSERDNGESVLVYEKEK